MLQVVLQLVLLASALASRHVLFERSAVPHGWSKLHKPERSLVLHLNLALRHRNLHVLDTFFNQVSDPTHQKYAKFMDIDEILNVIAPEEYEHDLVVKWANEYGAARIDSLRDSINIQASVHVIERMFETELHQFKNEYGRLIVRQLGRMSIPVHLADVIVMVSGISDFPQKTARKVREITNDDIPGVFIVPQSIQSMYKLKGMKADSKVSQCVAEFFNYAYSEKDLSDFFNKTELEPYNVTHKIGPFDPTYPDEEAGLDIEYISAIGTGAENWYWRGQDWIYDFAINFFQAKQVPDVVSISFGWSEIEQCSHADTDRCNALGIDGDVYVNRTNIEFQKIGLRGVSLVVAAGDSGANGRTDYACYDSTLHPIFPASSPFVTAVGATQLKNPEYNLGHVPKMCKDRKCASGGIEVAAMYDYSKFVTGGGFSIYGTRPSYQDEVVSAYLNSSVELPPSSFYTTSGRGYPDIAAIGNNFLIQSSGVTAAIYGTSASAPTVGGMFSLLNTYRIKNGHGKLGFANPFLYQMWKEHPNAFNDVTEGDNKCTESGCGPSCKGFIASKGWDPVSGLGTLNLDQVVAYTDAIFKRKNSETI
jgi:tripeptidyl-peptidase-1